jgi:uncharacterized radical SAM superfamily protein
MRKKVLLLNPPGKKIYIRDYYCSKTSQADYINHPVDFVVLSGILSRDNDVSLIDAIVDRLSPEECLRRIVGLSPDAVIFLTGGVSWPEDREFLASARRAVPSAEFIGLGDIFREDAAKYLAEAPFLSAVILDFTSDDAARYLAGERSGPANMVLAGAPPTVAPMRRGTSEFEIPVPRHELFIFKKYRYPFVRASRFATVLSEYGCPFDCSFCVMGTLGHKIRKVSNVVEELEYILRLGVREIFFATQTFGARRSYAVDLCRAIKPLNIGWTTFSRVDTVDEEVLSLMKEAGCHTIIFGIESGSGELLKRYRKGYDKERIRKIINLCADKGIETVGTFILGLPEETRDTMRETLDFIAELPLDYASFNVAVPRAGTDLRKEARAAGLAVADLSSTMDQSGSEIAMNTKHLSREEIQDFRRKAVRTFYLRPSYLLRRLASIRSQGHFLGQLRQFAAMLGKTWG